MPEDILFKKVFINKNTYVSNCRYWWKISKAIERKLFLKNTWSRKYSGFSEVMPMFEFHCGEKVIVINQYNPLEITGAFDERRYITAYILNPIVQNAPKCLVIWLILTKNNAETVIDLMKGFLLNDPSLSEKLQNIYASHEIE